MNLDSIEKIGRMITDAFGIAVSCFNPEGCLIYLSNELEINYKKYYLEDIHHVIGKNKMKSVIQINISEQAWTWIVVLLPEQDEKSGMLVIGPFYYNRYSAKAMTKTLKYEKLPEEERTEFIHFCETMPCLQYHESMNIAKLVFSFLYNKKIDDNEIKLINKAMAKLGERDDETVKESTMKAQLYATYLFEQCLKMFIRTGDIEKLKLLLDTTMHEKRGMMTAGVEPHQLKRLFMEAISLASDAAVEGGLGKDIAEQICDTYYRQLETLASYPDDFIDNMFLDFAGRLGKTKTSQGYCSYVEQCCEYIESHVNDNISVKFIADRLGISHEHLSRIFKHETGLSVVEYIKKIKIEEAKNMLKHTNLSLVEISEKLAFSSQSHFCTSFKEEMYITPKHFRDNHNNNILKMRNDIFVGQR